MFKINFYGKELKSKKTKVAKKMRPMDSAQKQKPKIKINTYN